MGDLLRINDQLQAFLNLSKDAIVVHDVIMIL